MVLQEKGLDKSKALKHHFSEQLKLKNILFESEKIRITIESEAKLFEEVIEKNMKRSISYFVNPSQGVVTLTKYIRDKWK